MKNIVAELVRKHLNKDGDHPFTFNIQDFYVEWFQVRGRAYTFVFKENLSTTNMQYAEIFPLIRQFSETKGEVEGGAQNILFHSSSDFKRTLSSVIQPYLEDAESMEDIDWDGFVEAYGSMLGYGMVADARFGTFSLYVPPTLSVAISQVCAQSGYIDSCGLQVYLCEVSKGSASVLVSSLKKYLLNRRKKSSDKHQHEKVRFEVWSHERSVVKKDSDAVINSLRIYADKVRLGSTKIGDLVDDFIKSDDFLNGEIQLESSGEDADGTIWVLQDRNAHSNGFPHPGNKRYILCYHQIFKNCNPLHYFDENKPAWIAPITLPHKLLGAMLNLTRPWNRQIKIHDPFCGTGSLIFEAFKDAQVYASGGDLSPMTHILAGDNASFLRLNQDDLKEISVALRNAATMAVELPINLLDPKVLLVLKTSENSILSKSNNYTRPFFKDFVGALEALVVLKGAPENSQRAPADFQYDAKFIKSFQELPLRSRMFFYSMLRTEVRFRESARTSTNWAQLFEKKCVELAEQMVALAAWKSRDRSINRARPRMPESIIGCRNADAGYFEVSMNPSSFEQFNASYLLARIQCVGAEQDWDKLVQSSDLYDCIVTDPPYGFNTEEDSSTLAKLYYRFLRKWIARIKPDGHLVLCLPQEAYNGQPLPSCTNPQIVISQILAIAIELNRTAFLPVRSLASNSPGSTAPYYWESAKVLRRTILHFQFIDMRTG